jgi:uncharacterized protein YndB with AHSA1/START domain
MGRYTMSRDIAATPAQVFAAFTDPAIAADWMAAETIRDVSGPLDQAGSTYTLVIRGPWRFHTTVVRSEPWTIHETMHRGRLGASARMVASLAERDGGTHLELLTEYTVPFGPIGRWIDRRWIDREPRPAANREFDRLVSLVSPPSEA